MNNAPFPPGTRFERLVIIDFTVITKNGHSWRAYHCKCDCGKETRVRSGKLTGGKTKSCGCYKASLTSIRNTKYAGNPAINDVITDYRCQAIRRGLEWGLDHEDASQLLTSPCAYCGRQPSRENVLNRHSAMVGGIDRYDNRLGYTPANSRPCCRFCNLAKLDHSPEEWEAWLDQLTAFRLKLLSEKS